LGTQGIGAAVLVDLLARLGVPAAQQILHAVIGRQGLGEVRGNAAEAVPSAAEHVVDAGDAFELLERDTRAIRA
jgi:hypothetical protein